MAILGPDQLPAVLQVPSDPIKMETLSTLGHPVVHVELTEPMLEQVIRTTGDFIAQYFQHEQRYAYFYTQPLVNDYPLPPDAYWVRDVKWDPATTRICLDVNARISTPEGDIKASSLKVGDSVIAKDLKSGDLVSSIICAHTGISIQDCREVITDSGHKLVTSLNHKFLTSNGWKLMRELRKDDTLCYVHSNDFHATRIHKFSPIEKRQTIDFQVADGNLIAEDLVVHNSDIFGAESFLFCHPGGSKVLTVKGSMLAETLYNKMNTKVITAFNPHKVRMRWNNKKQMITILRTRNDFLICTPNHPVSCNGKFIPAELCEPGDKLMSSNDKLCEIIDKSASHTDGTWSIQNKTGSQYISSLGKEFYLSH